MVAFGHSREVLAAEISSEEQLIDQGRLRLGMGTFRGDYCGRWGVLEALCYEYLLGQWDSKCTRGHRFTRMLRSRGE
jgi:hypothetical protein